MLFNTSMRNHSKGTEFSLNQQLPWVTFLWQVFREHRKHCAAFLSSTTPKRMLTSFHIFLKTSCLQKQPKTPIQVKWWNLHKNILHYILLLSSGVLRLYSTARDNWAGLLHRKTNAVGQSTCESRWVLGCFWEAEFFPVLGKKINKKILKTS